MIRRELIERAVRTLVAQLSVEQIYVIGSHAVGNTHATSDLDLIVVRRGDEPKARRDQRAAALLAPLLIPVDINVYTPDELARQLRHPYSFLRLNTQGHGKQVYSREQGFTFDVLPGGVS